MTTLAADPPAFFSGHRKEAMDGWNFRICTSDSQLECGFEHAQCARVQH